MTWTLLIYGEQLDIFISLGVLWITWCLGKIIIITTNVSSTPLLLALYFSFWPLILCTLCLLILHQHPWGFVFSPYSPESLNFRSGCPVSVRKLSEPLFSWYSPPGRPLHPAFPSWLYTQDFYPFLFLNFFLAASLFSYFAYLFMYIV